MKSAILISSLWMVVTSASVVPIDESSSTVNVKQGSHEYSYHIQESHGIAVQPVPLLKSQVPQHVDINSLQPKSSAGTDEKTREPEQPQVQARSHAKDEHLQIAFPGYPLLQGHGKEEGLQRQPLDQLRIALPGYQLLPGAGNGLIKEEELEKQQLKISLPGYRLLPANANIQYVDLPYYYPYVHGYGLQYPYNLPLVRYI